MGSAPAAMLERRSTGHGDSSDLDAQITRAERNGLPAWAELLRAKRDEVAEPAPGAEAAVGGAEGSGAVTRRLSDVQPEEITWLWQKRIPVGKLTLLVGDPGLGKSLITMDLAARVTSGRSWPDGAPGGPPGAVIVLNAEDDAADTVRPRLDAAGGDPRKAYVIDAIRERNQSGRLVARSFSLDRDLLALESTIKRVGDCRLVVIDPVSAYLGDGDSHVNADVRALLAPLSVLAAKCRVAVLAVSHLNKGSGSAIYRTSGSIAFVAASRAVWAIAKDPADESGARRLFLPVKNNVAADTGGLAYTITGSEVPTVEWGGSVTVDASEALSPDPEDRHEGADARAFLADFLGDGPRSFHEVQAAARANGVADRTLKGAKRALGVLSEKSGFAEGWRWSLPAKGAIEEAEEGHPVGVAPLGGVGPLREPAREERIAL